MGGFQEKIAVLFVIKDDAILIELELMSMTSVRILYDLI